MASPYDLQDLFGVKDLVVVITGGGSGLGRVVAHALAANGAKAVYVLGRRIDSLEETKKTALANREVITPITCDVTQKESLQAAAAQVRSEHGYCDVLFANSGIITASASSTVAKAKDLSIKELQEGLWQPDMDEFTKTLHVNVTGAFYTTIAFLDLLDEGNKRGVVPQKSQVVITTSISAYTRFPAVGFPYAASKAAAAHMAKQLATLLAPRMIRVNTIAPGFYPSEMTANMPFMKAGLDPREEGSLSQALVPLQRTGAEHDMAGAALFLLSKAGGYIDGNALVSDGGRISVLPASY